MTRRVSLCADAHPHPTERLIQRPQGWRQHPLRAISGALLWFGVTAGASAQGFDKVNTTVTNVNAILVTISVAVVTIAIIWAGFKMIFQGARLADVANVLLGGTLVGGAAAFASFIVS